jgi:4-hydroxybutyrate CoA-transferase
MSHPLDQLKVSSNSTVFIHTGAATPLHLIHEFCNRNEDRKNIKIYSLHTEGDAPWSEDRYRSIYIPMPFFVGPNIRSAIQHDHGSYVPATLHAIPGMFRKNIIPLDLALISVSPPDKHGNMSLGPSVDISRAAIESASKVVAQVNKYMPRTFGDATIHKSEIDTLIDWSEPLPERSTTHSSALDRKIALHVADLIQDGSTIQIGIGHIPDAILDALKDHKNLGLHSEVITDSILPLLRKNIITNNTKSFGRKHNICSFAIGSKALYDYLDDNPSFLFLESSRINQPETIALNEKSVAINSAIEIDLTGQVCADSLGPLIYSGAGGQPDFIRGSSNSIGGKPIIAMSSQTDDGKSKIVTSLHTGAGVVTTRTDVHWVVTEYGAVNLFGKSIYERAMLLTSIAHPSHRSVLWNTFESEYLIHH